MSPQRYKIYINQTPLILTQANSPVELTQKHDDRNLVARYNGPSRMLFNYIDMLEKNQQFHSVVLFSPDLDRLVRDFFSHFQLIEAAGGLVTNPEGKVLMIFRRGYWDLPKGKIDPGESPEAAAIREVQEETGLQNLDLIKLAGETYHTYREGKDRRILKKTYWYRMLTSDLQLHPQHDEDIELAEWVWPAEKLQEPGLPIYGNIREILAMI